jgi:branched-chain amino acid transport system permease protein
MSVDWLPSRFAGVDGTTGALAVAGVVLALLSLGFLFSSFVVTVPDASVVFLELAITWAIYGLLVLGLNVQYGYTGLINFGHLVFFLVGGYAFGFVTASGQAVGTGLGLHWLPGVVAALVAAAVLGTIIGATTLRLRGDFLAVVTVAALEVGLELVESFSEITGGTVGLYGLPRLIHAESGNPDTALLVTFAALLGLLLVVYAGITRLVESPYGRVLKAIRSDELVAQSLAKPTFRYKLQEFVYGSVLAGLAGALMAIYFGAVAPAFFSIDTTVIIWIGMLLGGAGNNRAVLAGMALILGIELGTRFLNEFVTGLVADAQFGAVRMIIIGLILIVVIRYRPAGIWGDEDEMEGIG